MMYGIKDLKPTIIVTSKAVECPILSCKKVVERQRDTFLRAERFRCPEHRIYISPSTYEYDHETDNLLWTSPADLALLDSIKEAKRESRMTRDNSDDAVTWNVFRFLEITDLLSGFLSSVTSQEEGQTETIYWSYSQKEGGAWTELNKARLEFGESPQRSSESDLIVVTQRTVFFIEAKLKAGNNTVPTHPEIYKRYFSGGSNWYQRVFFSDFRIVAIQARKYELMRFWLIGSWIAAQRGLNFCLVNLVPATKEKDIEERFIPLIRQSESRQFKRLAWEEILKWVSGNAPDSGDKNKLVDYFRNKTFGYNRQSELQKAFYNFQEVTRR